MKGWGRGHPPGYLYRAAFGESSLLALSLIAGVLKAGPSGLLR